MTDAKQIEAVARAICPYKIRPCPGWACRVCADVARAAIKAMKDSEQREGVSMRTLPIYEQRAIRRYTNAHPHVSAQGLAWYLTGRYGIEVTREQVEAMQPRSKKP